MHFIKYLILLCPVIIVIITVLLDSIGVESICLLKLITGHKCLGCGMTHAFICVLQGKFIEAFQYNFLVIIVFPIVAYCWLKYVYANFIKVKLEKK